jgi:hypothetical protein
VLLYNTPPEQYKEEWSRNVIEAQKILNEPISTLIHLPLRDALINAKIRQMEEDQKNGVNPLL